MATKLNALLVALRVQALGTTRKDKQVTDEVTESHALADDAGAWVKRLLPKQALARVNRIASGARAWHLSRTLTYDDGLRVLAGAVRERYDAELVEWQGRHADAVAEFVAAYPVEY